MPAIFPSPIDFDHKISNAYNHIVNFKRITHVQASKNVQRIGLEPTDLRLRAKMNYKDIIHVVAAT